MKIAICDDLRFDRTLLCEYILQYAKNNFINIEVVEFDSGEEMLSSFLEEKYKIVFLDIYMKGIDGVEVAEKIRETDEDCKIIFTTSSVDHKGEGFEVAATHYLIKPITYKRVEQALNRCKKVLAFDAQYVELPLGKETVKINLRDILYVEAVRNGVVINTEYEEYKIHMPMVYINRLYLKPDKQVEDIEVEFDEQIQQIIHYINGNLSGDLSITALSEKFYINKYYLMHKFKANTGFSIHSYVNNKRLQKSAALIKEGKSPSDAAGECGFNDYSNFVRTFSKMYGMSPRKYCKSALEHPVNSFQVEG